MVTPTTEDVTEITANPSTTKANPEIYLHPTRPLVTTYSLGSPWVEVAYIFLIMCIGFLGNTLIIASYVFNKSIRNTTNTFIVNAAVSDLIVIILVFPFMIANILQDGLSVSDAGCHILGWVVVFSFATSVNTFQVIAINRYINICWPHIYERIFKKKVVIGLLVYVWICILPVKGGFILADLERTYYVKYLRLCFVYTETHPVDAVFCISFTMFAALSSMFCYFKIIHHIYSSSRKMKQHQQEISSASKTGAVAPAAKSDKEFKATIALLTALFMFVIFYIPFSIVHLIDAFSPMPHVLLRGLWFINILNFVANGVVYGVLNRQFRRAYRRILCFWRPKNKVIDSSSDATTSTSGSKVTGVSRLTRATDA